MSFVQALVMQLYSKVSDFLFTLSDVALAREFKLKLVETLVGIHCLLTTGLTSARTLFFLALACGIYIR